MQVSRIDLQLYQYCNGDKTGNIPRKGDVHFAAAGLKISCHFSRFSRYGSLRKWDMCPNFFTNVGYMTAKGGSFSLGCETQGGIMHGKILVYGDDLQLLTTRRSLLESAGYWVYTTSEFADAMLMLMSHQISVLLLCQSAQSDERSGGLKF